MVKRLAISPKAGNEPIAIDFDYGSIEVKKRVSLFVPISDWRLLRLEAARRRQPMTELVRTWIAPQIADLRRRGTEPNPDVD